MEKKRLIILFMILLFIFLSCNVGYTQEEAQIYSRALEAIKSGDIDFAFLYFHSLLTNYPESKYTQEALFATGEYYFLIADYRDAAAAFIRFVGDYPNSKAKPFALAYLLKIAEKGSQESLVKNLENKIATLQRLSLLFRKFKEYKYRSPLYRKHRVIYYVDKVEFYIDGQLFAKISY